METIFLQSFFTVMVHLVIHLALEVKIAGPVQYRWMYPIERYLRKLKSYVRNLSCSEGSIAEAYIANECLQSCSLYMALLSGGRLIAANDHYTMNLGFIVADTLHKLIVLGVLVVWAYVSKMGILECSIAL